MSRRRTNNGNVTQVQIRDFLHILASVSRVKKWIESNPDPDLVRDVLVLEERQTRSTSIKALKSYLEQTNET
jgi:hypothetical protein